MYSWLLLQLSSEEGHLSGSVPRNEETAPSLGYHKGSLPQGRRPRNRPGLLCRAKPISGTLTLHLILNIWTKTKLGASSLQGSTCVTQASKPPLVGVQDVWWLGKAVILIVGSQDGKDRNIFSYPHQSQTLMFALGRTSDSHSDRKA